MLIRISLIVALIGALAVGALNILVVKDKINTLVNDRNSQRSQKETALSDLARTKTDLASAKKELDQTKTDLAAAKTEKDKAVKDMAVQQKRADDLSDKLAKTSQDLDATQTKLAAYVATGFKPEDIGKLGRTLKDAQEALEVATEEKTVLLHTVTRLTNEIFKLVGPGEYVVKLRSDLKGKILVVDPKFDFVVLNVGEDQGVIEDGELLVSRDGKLVAKVVVRSVEKNRSIANVIPGWKLGEVIEGDEVTPAHPAS